MAKKLLANVCFALVLLLQQILAAGSLGAGAGDPSVAVCTSGRQLVAALADPLVEEAIVPLDLQLSARDFEGYPQPIVRARNFTISGTPDRWPVFDGGRVKARVQLQRRAALTLRHLVLRGMRDSSLIQAPGLDLLLPVSADEPSLLHFDSAAMFLYYGFPPDITERALQTVARPAALPGNQTYDMDPQLQPGCLNASTTPAAQFQAAPYMERCWAWVAWFGDMAGQGADVDPATARPVPNGFTVWMTNLFQLCENLYSAQCVAELGPLGCALYTRSRLLRPLPPLPALPPPPLPALPPPPLPVLPPPPAQAAGGRGDSRRRLLAVVLGSALGAVAGVLALAAAALLVARARKRRSVGKGVNGGDVPGRSPHTTITTVPYTEALLSIELAGASLSCGGAKQGSGGLADPQFGPLAVKALAVAAPADLRRSEEVVTMSTPPREDVQTGVALVDDQPYGRRQAGQAGKDAEKPAAGAEAFPWPGESGESSSANGSSYTSDRQPASRPAPAEVRLSGVLLGRGAYGRVYEGTYGGQVVAVKLLHVADPVALEQGPARPGQGQAQGREPGEPAAAAAVAMPVQSRGGGSLGPSDEALRSLTQEVELLGRCRHPAIVRLLAVSLAPPRPCLVMERCETSLQALLYGDGGGQDGSRQGARRQLLPLSKVLHIGTQIAAGLEYLHPTITHRDLKPGNVLINGAGSEWPQAKLADFGLSRLRLATMATNTPEAGTPAYTAPECFDLRNFVVTHHVDVYSLGVVLWEMLAGRPPWQGLTPVELAICVALHGQRLPLDQLSSARCPPLLADLIAQCWEADPRRRPAAAEVAKRLTLMQGQLAVAPASGADC